MGNNVSCGCGPASEPQPKKETQTQTVVQPNSGKHLDIQFMYLDISTCQRCQGTNTTVEESLEEMQNVLTELGYSYFLEKIHINSMELAKKYAFVSSPTIRINGKDIVLEDTESNCSTCGDVCGEEVDCRDWEWNGEIYSYAPKGMIMDAILRSVFDKNFGQFPDMDKYEVPENIVTFFEGVEAKKLASIDVKKEPEVVSEVTETTSGGCGCGC